MLDQATAFAKDVDTALVPVVDLVLTYCRIGVRGDPYAGKVIAVNAILYELTESVFVHVNAASLPVMNLALDDRRIGSSFHLEARDAVIVNVIFLKVSLKDRTQIRRKSSRRRSICLTIPLSNVKIPTSRPW